MGHLKESRETGDLEKNMIFTIKTRKLGKHRGCREIQERNDVQQKLDIGENQGCLGIPEKHDIQNSNYSKIRQHI